MAARRVRLQRNGRPLTAEDVRALQHARDTGALADVSVCRHADKPGDATFPIYGVELEAERAPLRVAYVCCAACRDELLRMAGN